MKIERNTAGEITSLTMTQPDDWHVHLRDGVALEAVVSYTAAQFGRALIMPNLKIPVTTVDQALAYKGRIGEALLNQTWYRALQPLMMLYLTNNTTSDEVYRAKARSDIAGFKYYPAGATTNSAAGVTDIRKCYAVLEAMQHAGQVLCAHGEVTDPEVDIFDREAVFIDRVLGPLRHDFPELKMVMEHITTKQGVQYVMAGNEYIAATITPQHLLYNRNAIFTGGLQPHFYCLPVLKSEEHRLALVAAATSGSPRFFLGTDSAPHSAHLKEQAGGHAGCFSACSALEFYTEAFEIAGALDNLEGFASFYGADFYVLPRNTRMVTLRKESWTLPESVPFGDAVLKPLRSGQEIPWKFVTS